MDQIRTRSRNLARYSRTRGHLDSADSGNYACAKNLRGWLAVGWRSRFVLCGKRSERQNQKSQSRDRRAKGAILSFFARLRGFGFQESSLIRLAAGARPWTVWPSICLVRPRILGLGDVPGTH